ncbi:MAG: hypothetical protein IPI48_08525 [bacterium]|nr:hypothetical protein [bacterium]
MARTLASKLECRVIPLGHPEQKERLSRLEVLLSSVPSGLSRDTLLEVVLLLSQCDLFIADNTDAFHFAVAMDVPTVGLFRAEVPPCWIPSGRAHVRILTLESDGRVDPEALLAAVEAVVGPRRRTSGVAPVVSAPEAEAGTTPAAPVAPEPPAVSDATSL